MSLWKSIIFCIILCCVDMSERPDKLRAGRESMTQGARAKKDGESQQKKEGEIENDVTQLKKKAKPIMTCHDIKCKGFQKQINVKMPIYNFSKLRRSGRTSYFGPQPNLGAPGTAEDNPIEIDEGKNKRDLCNGVWQSICF